MKVSHTKYRETHTRVKRTSLDGLRGWAVVAIALYHAILHNDLSLIERVLKQPIQTQSGLSDMISKVVHTVGYFRKSFQTPGSSSLVGGFQLIVRK